MPPRGPRLRIEDILVAVSRIQEYTAGMTLESFRADQKALDAVIRNFEVIGEAARHVPDDTSKGAKHVSWADVRDMRTSSSTNASESTSP